MTKKWLCQTPDPPQISVFSPLTKKHKPVPGCEGSTEKLSAFVDKLLHPIAQQQKSSLKDTTAFVNLIGRTKVPEKASLVSMDTTSLYTFKYTTRRGDPNRMKSIRFFLSK